MQSLVLLHFLMGLIPRSTFKGPESHPSPFTCIANEGIVVCEKVMGKKQTPTAKLQQCLKIEAFLR